MLKFEVDKIRRSATNVKFERVVTQSKSKTIITRSMLTISLIVFTDKLQGHVHTFYSKWFFITF